jgi:hypothetical protein
VQRDALRNGRDLAHAPYSLMPPEEACNEDGELFFAITTDNLLKQMGRLSHSAAIDTTYKGFFFFCAPILVSSSLHVAMGSVSAIDTVLLTISHIPLLVCRHTDDNQQHACDLVWRLRCASLLPSWCGHPRFEGDCGSAGESNAAGHGEGLIISSLPSTDVYM